MRIFQDFTGVEEIPSAVLTIGTFDGVHLGHQKIIERLNEEAEKIGGESVLFTFYPHPRMVLYPESHGLQLIQTQVEKIEKLKRIGLQNVIVYPFTKEFSRLTALEFVRDYLVNKLHVKKLVIGYDHQFGKNREGTLEFLKEISDTYGFEVIEIEAQEIDEVNISSTKIRNAVIDGDMQLAEEYLGEPFELHGRVIKGKELGREIGYPTANIEIGSDVKITPKTGVYGVKVTLEDERTILGMLNLGSNPTVGTINDEKLAVEAHLLDFNEEIYGQYLKIQLISWFRDEIKFDTVDQLKEQLKKDETTIRNYFSANMV